MISLIHDGLMIEILNLFIINCVVGNELGAFYTLSHLIPRATF